MGTVCFSINIYSNQEVNKNGIKTRKWKIEHKSTTTGSSAYNQNMGSNMMIYSNSNVFMQIGITLHDNFYK